MNISVRKLASIANVSTATVSMVLNNKPGIGADTRKRVLDIAKQYGFEPAAESSVVTREGKSIQLIMWNNHGLIIADNPFFTSITEGVIETCTQHGCSLNIVYVYASQDIASQLESIKEKQSDGYIVMATEMSGEDLPYLKVLDAPVVLLDGYFPGCGYDCVCINNFQAAADAVDYLFSCGHRKIGYFQSNIFSTNFKEREAGYWASLHRHGEMLIPKEHLHPMKSLQDVSAVVNAPGFVPADAYLVDADLLAVSVIKVLHDSGYRIPRDISLISIDDMPFSEALMPSLTTMRVDKKELGIAAVQRLIYRIANPKEKVSVLLQSTSLIIRDSVARRA
ncbi:MAG TPA: LacI family transcriptional regulator [Lachnospiraceae bacterium]|nr:LacI family transcriptional regulator [Lachnospiraceae bacterium]